MRYRAYLFSDNLLKSLPLRISAISDREALRLVNRYLRKMQRLYGLEGLRIDSINDIKGRNIYDNSSGWHGDEEPPVRAIIRSSRGIQEIIEARVERDTFGEPCGAWFETCKRLTGYAMRGFRIEMVTIL